MYVEEYVVGGSSYTREIAILNLPSVSSVQFPSRDTGPLQLYFSPPAICWPTLREKMAFEGLKCSA